MKLFMLQENIDNSTAIFIDQDETLLRGYLGIVREFFGVDAHNINESNLRDMCQKHDVFVITKPVLYMTKKRPNVDEFLQELSNMFDNMYVLTAGRTNSQSKILNKLGLLEYFDGIFGDPWENIPKHKESYLVDNLQNGDSVLDRKLNVAGVPNSNFIHVEPWYGGDDNSLVSVLADIKSRMGEKE